MSINEIVFGNKNEWSTDTCYNIDETWKHHAKRKKPDIKGNILYCMYIKYPE